jgi:RNA polymerase sigma-70 factor (ECF subfamily)
VKDLTEPEQRAADLFARARGGEREAFDALIEMTRDPLRAAVGQRMGARLRKTLEVDDVLQETYVRALQAFSGIRWQGLAGFQRWLAAIAEHLIIDSARREKRYPKLELPQHLPGEGVSQSKHLRRDERFQRLKASLSKLSEDHREVILLSRIEGLKTEEVARRMNRSVTAVRNLLLRALKELKSSFGETESLSLPERSLEEEGSSDGR